MMRLSEAARVLGGRLEGADALFTSVSTDTRTLQPDSLFVALRGDKYDGHGFIDQARAAGSVGALVEESAAGALRHVALVRVGNTRLALGELAHHWRARFSTPLVALTGSSGKTTVKEMLASILDAAVRSSTGEERLDAVLATRGNLNNDIGVPLTLLDLKPEHLYAVIEMGMNHAGEIRYLTGLARPDVAIVNNAGTAHIEFLGSQEAIARAKGEIFEGLDEAGTAVINADDAFAPLWRELAGARRRVEFGLEHPADVTAQYELRATESAIVLEAGGSQARIVLPTPGLHNVRNALAAAAGARALDIPLDAIASGLRRFAGIKGRLQTKRGLRGATVIDDTYNANPESMRAALAVLAGAPGRKFFVVGDMGELGADAPGMHEALGAVAREARIERLFALGEHSSRTAAAFGPDATHYARVEDLIADLRATLGSDVTVLVKGSRFMRMERVVEALAGAEAPGAKKNDGGHA